MRDGEREELSRKREEEEKGDKESEKPERKWLLCIPSTLVVFYPESSKASVK